MKEKRKELKKKFKCNKKSEQNQTDKELFKSKLELIEFVFGKTDANNFVVIRHNFVE